MRRFAAALLAGIVLAAQGVSMAEARPPDLPTGTSPVAAPHADPAHPMLSAMSGGNTVGADARENTPRSDGYRHIDTPTLVRRLTAMHATTYTFGIWDSPTDWNDLRTEFMPAAKKAHIEVMVYLVPPSECFQNPQKHLAGRCSRPFALDYQAWARNIADLSKKYPNLTSWAIDDFLVSGANAELFTKDYLASLRSITNGINPGLKFYVTLYSWQIDDKNMTLIQDSLDGVIFPYLGYNNNGIDDTYLEKRLDEYVPRVKSHGMSLILLVYTGRFLDGILPPTGDYVSKVLDRAVPYLNDGRIGGIISYGAPLQIDKQKPSSEYRARSGGGRLSLSVGNFQATPNGANTQAAQRVTVDPKARSLSLTFHHTDQEAPGTLGYHVKQLLVNGAVAWESDVAADPRDSWITTTVDLTAALKGKREATIAFRLIDKMGVGWWPMDVGIDDLTADGIIVRNPGFEDASGWTLTRSDPSMQPYIDLYHADEPVRVINAIGAAYADILGQGFTPLTSPSWPTLRPSPANVAMYGNGRLSFSVPDATAVPAGTCTTATQRMKVDTSSPRQEISFWHTDRIQAGHRGQLFKKLLIDGKEVWGHDIFDYWPWDYINGSDQQGPIDVTDFVAGKRAVDLTFALCADGVTDLGIDVSFDRVQTIGLGLRNGEFEQDGGWTLKNAGALSAEIVRTGPAVPVY